MTLQTITIEGGRIHDIPSFYDEINRVFKAPDDWKLGPSLDALNDMLYGYSDIEIIWRDAQMSKAALGHETTRQHYVNKLSRPNTYNVKRIESDIAALDAGTGPTYFDIVLDIIASHSSIHLTLV